MKKAAVDTQKINVIYIAGCGHSGSTLFDLVLGAHSKIESLGEFYKIFDPVKRAAIKDCTCGSELHQCDFWKDVFFNDEHSCVNQLSEPEKTYNVLTKILDKTGKSFVCDSSKSIPNIEVYESRPDLFQLYVIHLVRDPRAYVKSIENKKQRVGVGESVTAEDKNPKMYNYSRAIWRWVLTNFRLIVKGIFGIKSSVVRYEDLCSDPARTLTAVLSRFDLSFEEEQLGFSTLTHHNISGNRMRNNKNQMIKFEGSYLKKGSISKLKWGFATFFTSPLLILFKYPFSRKAPF